MAENVRFPDTAQVVSDMLYAALSGVPVGTRVPNQRPAKFVLVRRLGGPIKTLVSDGPLIGVEVWAPTQKEAATLAEDCRQLVRRMANTVQPDGTVVYRVTEVGGPQDLPDPTTASPRYVFTHELHVRGVAA